MPWRSSPSRLRWAPITRCASPPRSPPRDADGDGAAETRLLSRAYEGIDRFDKRANDAVAVFVDAETADPVRIAEAAARALAHAAGAVALDPDPATGGEVMDGADGALPAFWAAPAPIPGSDETHSPLYHLRRHWAGEPAETLAAEGLRAGSYDAPGAGLSLVRFELTLEALDRPLTSLFLLTGTEAGRAEGGADASLVALGADLAPGARIAFSLPEGTPLRLLAATGAAETLDVAFDLPGADPETGFLAAAPGLSLDAPLIAGGESLGRARLAAPGSETVAPGANAAIAGGAGDDVLTGGWGDDFVRGNAGRDTMVYDLPRAEVERGVGPGGELAVRLPNGEVDRLFSIERLALSDGVWLYDLSGETAELVYRLYAASLGRTPDEQGLRFWTAAAREGLPPDALAGAFVSAPEFDALFGEDPSDAEVVAAFYRTVLRREPEPAGDAFWQGALATGDYDRADMLLFFADSPENRARVAPDVEDGLWVVD